VKRQARDLDEDDIRVRPGRGSRPRSRLRPAHPGASEGVVVAVDRGRFGCLVGDREVLAVRARELGRKSVVVGDRVALVGDVSGRPDTLARLVRVEPRTSVLRRSADDSDPVERVLVANADQLAIVSAVADPRPSTRLIDRYLVAAFDGGLRPLLVLTKADLGDPAPLLEAYAALDLPVAVSARKRPEPMLADLLRDRVTVFAGHSGVGKSTLINTLVPGAARATGAVNEVTGRGRHVSASTVVFDLPGGGQVIDTPGVRTFGLAHVQADRVVAAFPDLSAGTADCPRGCRHRADEGTRTGTDVTDLTDGVEADNNGGDADDVAHGATDNAAHGATDDAAADGGGEVARCALDDWVAAGHASAARLASLRRLLAATAPG
jgi:ribosome biogenesis GTPase